MVFKAQTVISLNTLETTNKRGRIVQNSTDRVETFKTFELFNLYTEKVERSEQMTMEEAKAKNRTLELLQDQRRWVFNWRVSNN